MALSAIASATGPADALAQTAGPAAPRRNVPLPPLDLGQTSFLDGEATPGFLLEIIGNDIEAHALTDQSGRNVAGRQRQSIETLIVHPVFVSRLPLLGGTLGVDLLVPFARIYQASAPSPPAAANAIGDVTGSVFVQWSHLTLAGRPLSLRVSLQVAAPLGGYAASAPISIGSNAWQVSPYVAATWHATHSIEISSRVTYDWSGRNDKAPAATDAATSRSGDQLAINLSASYAVTTRLRLGPAGYALRQLHRSELDDRSVGRRQQVTALGPGVRWNTGHLSLIATGYREFAARNRPKGYNIVLRALRTF